MFILAIVHSSMATFCSLGFCDVERSTICMPSSSDTTYPSLSGATNFKNSIMLRNVFAGDPPLKYICESSAPRLDSSLFCSASLVILYWPSALDSCRPSRTASRHILCGIPSFLLAGISFVAVSLLANSSRTSFLCQSQAHGFNMCCIWLTSWQVQRFSGIEIHVLQQTNRFVSKTNLLKFPPYQRFSSAAYLSKNKNTSKGHRERAAEPTRVAVTGAMAWTVEPL